jgi:hypothetical protein
MGLFNAPRAYPRFYEPFYEQFNFYDGREEWLRSIEKIPEKAVNLFSIHWLHLEVYNGGFWQYFFNSTGTSAPEACRGFAAIGMPEVAAVVSEAMRKLGSVYPTTVDARREIVGGPEKRMDFSDFNSTFYDLADTEQLFRKKPKFVPFADRYAEID